MFEDCKNYGVDINMSIVFDEDGCCQAGLHMTDSDGYDIEVESDGEDFYDVMDDIICEVSDIVASYDETEYTCYEAAKMIVDLQDEIKSLKIDNMILQQRVDAIVNDTAAKRQAPHSCSCSDHDDDGIESLIKMMNTLYGRI